MPQDERIKIIMDIMDNSPSPSKFMDYFSSEDLRIIKDKIGFDSRKAIRDSRF